MPVRFMAMVRQPAPGLTGHMTTQQHTAESLPTLVTGGTGKTGQIGRAHV